MNGTISNFTWFVTTDNHLNLFFCQIQSPYLPQNHLYDLNADLHKRDYILYKISSNKNDWEANMAQNKLFWVAIRITSRKNEERVRETACSLLKVILFHFFWFNLKGVQTHTKRFKTNGTRTTPIHW